MLLRVATVLCYIKPTNTATSVTTTKQDKKRVPTRGALHMMMTTKLSLTNFHNICFVYENLIIIIGCDCRGVDGMGWDEQTY